MLFRSAQRVVSRLTTRWAAKWLLAANVAGIWTKWELRVLATKRCRKPLKFTNTGVVMTGHYYGNALSRTFVVDDIVDVEKFKLDVNIDTDIMKRFTARFGSTPVTESTPKITDVKLTSVGLDHHGLGISGTATRETPDGATTQSAPPVAPQHGPYTDGTPLL